MDHHLHALAEKIWLYHLMGQRLNKSDAICVLCSHDELVAERGAELFLEGWAPLLIFSGGLGAITRKMWTEPEAERFAEIAVACGVPRQDILIENRSTNTGENILFTKQLLTSERINISRMLVVQKPYMERRAYATFRKLWPEIAVTVTSPQMTFDEYVAQYSNREFNEDDVVSIMVGDLQRIKLYPARGFQVDQQIPGEVWAAYEELVRAGYSKHLIAS